jgi:hypothetical protein
MPNMETNEFFETDEPFEDVKAAFDAGVKGLTGLPGGARIVTQSHSFSGVHTNMPSGFSTSSLAVLQEPALTA